MNRTVFAYVYLAPIAVGVVLLNAWMYPFDTSHPDDPLMLVYLILAGICLSLTDVRLDRGHLTLSGLAAGAAAILFNPVDGTLVGIATAIGLRGRGRFRVVANAVIYAAIVSIACAVRSTFPLPLTLGARLVVLAVVNANIVILVTTSLAVRHGESVLTVVRHNLSASFILAFAYLSLAALMVSYVLDGSALGYFLATIVCVLALALTDTIAGRRVRRVLESELSDADRHLFHSRAVEGVVHNLRNHVATAVGYLKEIDPRRLDPVDRDAIETATAAANDAVTVLRGLSQGATPRVSYATEPVDLNELVTRAVGMARPRARSKEVELAVRESADEVKVRADPLLLREVITNLVNNAIDAAPVSGRVELIAGRRANGWPYITVGDNGPGVSEDHRHHLFEPHFTTKEGGTGLGLFISYGVVREHQGQLLYEGNRRGARFTVVLPPFSG